MQIFIAQLFVKVNLLEESKDATSGGLYSKLGFTQMCLLNKTTFNF